MERSCIFKDIVVEPLTMNSKKDWFEWVKNYLISQDLWKVTSSSSRPERHGVKDFGRWRRKNAAALHVIRTSCGTDNHSFIRGVSEAKAAWDILFDTYNNNHNPPPPPPPPPPLPPPVVTMAEESGMGALYNAIADKKWSVAEACIDRHRRVLNVGFATLLGETPLHVAAKFGCLAILEKLLELVPPEYLEIRSAYFNYTPLAIAATHSAAIPIAKCMIARNKNIISIPSRDAWAIPATLAFICGNNKMGRYLYSVTPLRVFKRENSLAGPHLLRNCLRLEEFDIVLDLLQRCPKLLFATTIHGFSTLGDIALFLPNPLVKSQLPPWKRWAYQHIQQEGESNQAGHQGIGLLHWLFSSIKDFSGMKEIYKMKLKHAKAAKILDLVCENLKFLNKAKRHMIANALIDAADVENVDFLLRVTKANPEISTLATFGYLNLPIFFKAVKDRKAEIFNVLHGFRFKNVVGTIAVNDTEDTLLHVAALLAHSSYLNRIPGAALQMQRELQWFKAVESVVDPRYRHVVNKKGLKPLEFFKENHKQLRVDGEQWMKDTASSCSVVGALIVTIMFAAALTVPGGNNQNSGYPMLMEEQLFKVFLISDALSLFSSTTSVLTFLGMLTSRYAEEDFLYSLPKKLIIGLSTLFLSIATMMVAFSATIMIMLQHNSSRLWVILPVPILASVPVSLFVFLQFPLLVEVFSSTYGPGIFKKKVEKWP